MRSKGREGRSGDPGEQSSSEKILGIRELLARPWNLTWVPRGGCPPKSRRGTSSLGKGKRAIPMVWNSGKKKKDPGGWSGSGRGETVLPGLNGGGLSGEQTYSASGKGKTSLRGKEDGGGGGKRGAGQGSPEADLKMAPFKKGGPLLPWQGENL